MIADEQLITDLLHAYDSASITRLPSQREGGFNLESGYRIGRVLHERLLGRGFQAVGRKIGFTNPATWREFNLDTPVWATMYAQTVHFKELGRFRLALNSMVAPRIEPEIVFKLRRPLPSGDTSAEDIVPCLEWAALGFEIVDSHYPDWRFTAADAIADFGVHAALIVGTPWYLREFDAREVVMALETVKVVLRRGTEFVVEGEGRNALGSPLLALGHLARLLDSQPWAPALAAGEIITTGTLTPPPYIYRGENWRAVATGASLLPLELDL